MADKTVVDVMLGEAGGGSRASRYADMMAIASAIHNRSVALGVPAKSVVGLRSEFNASGKGLPKGVEAYRGLAEKAWTEVTTKGPVHTGMFFAPPDATKGLPKGLTEVARSPHHAFFSDPKGRAINTTAGYKTPSIGRTFAVTPAIGPTPASRALSPVEAKSLMAGRFGPAAASKMADAKSQAKTESRISTAFGVTGRPMALTDPAAMSKAIAATASRYSDPASGRVATAFSNVGKAPAVDPAAMSKAVASYGKTAAPAEGRFAAAFAPAPTYSPAAVAALAGLAGKTAAPTASKSAPSISAPSPGIAAAMAEMGKGMRSQGVLGMDGKVEGRLAEARGWAANPAAYRSDEATGRVATAHGRAPTASIAAPEALGRAVASIAGRMAPVALGPAMTAPVAMTPTLSRGPTATMSRGPVATMSRAPTMTTMSRAPVSYAPAASRGTVAAPAAASPLSGLLGLLSGVFGPGGMFSGEAGAGGMGGGMGAGGQAGIGGFGVGGQSGHDYSGR